MSVDGLSHVDPQPYVIPTLAVRMKLKGQECYVDNFSSFYFTFNLQTCEFLPLQEYKKSLSSVFDILSNAVALTEADKEDENRTCDLSRLSV